MHSRFAFWLIPLALVVVTCGKPPPSPTADLPALAALTPDPARVPDPGQKRPDQTQVSVSQLVVSYRGAEGAYPRIVLDHAQARARAAALVKLARCRETSFAELARKFSNDSASSGKGGDLGVISQGQLHPDLEAAAFRLEVGQVSDPVETPRGFHLLLRQPPSEGQGQEIVIAYSGGKRYQPRIARTREQALELARTLLTEIRQGASFDDRALWLSDLPSAVRGGHTRIFARGTSHPKFEEIFWPLPIGGVSEVVETPTGFHIIKRLPVERILLRGLRIDFLRGDEEEATLRRTREEALRLAQETRARALDPEQDFAELAFTLSDDDKRNRGGLFEPVGRGVLAYPIELAAFALQPGQVSEVLDSERGFVIIKRIR